MRVGPSNPNASVPAAVGTPAPKPVAGAPAGSTPTPADGFGPASAPGNAPPITVSEPSLVTTADQPITLTSDASADHWSASFSLPLDALASPPLTGAQVAEQIAAVQLPAPWSADASAPFAPMAAKVENGRLFLSAPAVEPGAFDQVPPRVLLTLKSGQLVNLEVKSPQLQRDTTAFTRSNLQSGIASEQEQVSYWTQNAAHAKAAIGHPETNATVQSDQLQLSAATTQANQAQAALDTARQSLDAAWATATPVNRLVALHMAIPQTGNDDLKAESMAALAGNNALVAAQNHVKQAADVVDALTSSAIVGPLLDDAKATLAEAQGQASALGTAQDARLASLEAHVTAAGLHDQALTALDCALTPPTGSGFDRKLVSVKLASGEVARLTAQAGSDTARAQANAPAWLSSAQAEVASAQSRLATLQGQLAALDDHPDVVIMASHQQG